MFKAEGKGHGFFNGPPWTDVTLRQADLFLIEHKYLPGETAIKESTDNLIKVESQ
jgi:hypothetical protein